MLHFLRKPHWNFDKAFLLFGLFDYKWDAHKFLKMRVRYSLINSWLYFLIMAFFFEERTNTCFFFNWSGNFPSMMHWLKFYKIKLAKIVALSLIVLTGIFCNCVDFEVSKLLISFRISSWVIFRKEDTLLFIFSLMLRTLGWTLHFLIAFEKNQIHRSFQREIVYLCQFSKCFLCSQKAYWRYQQPFLLHM